VSSNSGNHLSKKLGERNSANKISPVYQKHRPLKGLYPRNKGYCLPSDVEVKRPRYLDRAKVA